jgi:hypothetical protein
MAPDPDRRIRSRQGFGRVALGCLGCGIALLLGGGALLLFGYFVLRPKNQAAVERPVAIAVATPAGQRRLNPLWSVPLQGNNEGITCRDLDSDGADELVIGTDRGALIVKRDGTEWRRLRHTAEYTRFAVVRAAGGPLLVGMSSWSDDIRAYDMAGKQRWSYRTGDAVDWACALNLGDPAGEGVAIGYNGAGGLHVVDACGKVRTRIGGGLANAWCVAPVRVGAGKPDAIGCTDAEGMLRLYDSRGSLLQNLQPGGYCTGLLTTDLDGDGADELLGLGAEVQEGFLGELKSIFTPPERDLVAAFDARGTLQWRYYASLRSGLQAGGATAGRFLDAGRQVVVGGIDGSLTFLDPQGNVMTREYVGQAVFAVACLQGYSPTRDALVVLTGRSCMAYAAP